MEHYIGLKNQFNKIGSDYQSVTKTKGYKNVYLVCNQFFNTHVKKNGCES